MTASNQWLDTAIEASRIGGKILLGYQGKVNSETIQTKQVGDWVSEADKASETEIMRFLSAQAPDHSILTEETGYIQRDKPAEYRWIIDPLDGTTNFLRGVPIWAVSVALEHRIDPKAKWGDIIAGAIHIPLFNETYYASKGNGAYRNGEPIKAASEKPFNECLLSTGFPFRTRHLIKRYMDLFGEVLNICADARRPGAVAVDLCYVASGFFDGFWELDLAPWDIAAGSLIIQEAGGLVSNFQGDQDILTSGDIVAGSSGLFPKLLNIVTKHFPKPRDVDKSTG